MRKLITAAATAALILALGPLGPAGAVSVTLGPGPLGNPQVATRLTSALYASGADGTTVLITEIGAPAPNGGVINEIGVPSVAPDGTVVFGAAVRKSGGPEVWGVFAANPRAPGGAVRRVIDVAAASPACRPKFNGDPYPIGGADGAIAFAAPEASGGDAVFLYHAGQLKCVARVGTPTNRGRTLATLGFGSLQMGRGEDIVLTAWLRDSLSQAPSSRPAEPYPDRQAVVLITPSGGVTEIAVEGEHGFARSPYGGAFGLPVAVAGENGTEIAFEAQTHTGEGLYLYRDGTLKRVLGYGTMTAFGRITYLSMGRPGLAPDGATSALIASGSREALVVERDTRARVAVRQGRYAPNGARLRYLGDPSLTTPGAVLFGAIDDADHEALYVIDSAGRLRNLEHAGHFIRVGFNPGRVRHTVFSASFYANSRGDFAYLGGK